MAKIMIVVLELFVAGLAWACDKGCTTYNDVCACDIVPQSAPEVVKPSDEQPSRHPEPAWQRGDVKTVEIPSFKNEGEEADAQIKFANGAGLAHK